MFERRKKRLPRCDDSGMPYSDSAPPGFRGQVVVRNSPAPPVAHGIPKAPR